ncbi:hypothetical protein DSCW_43060 [Desulfosarcina widdelii]|uniref:Uncharacterized protein n=1 Tax=Desulfosarcina widdelii TaxID=947919 RepID=A0A5K7Z9S1_9BACT|nr:hypothetical protein [Desulfosarcina widdelii]BBO76889.1 hypothetical protein DSCW_43060 [Desulfosarcina widdelii]
MTEDRGQKTEGREGKTGDGRWKKTITKPHSRVVNTVVAAIVFFTLCTACSRGDDADKILAQIARGAERAEAHDIGGLLKLASEGVVAMPMNLDRNGIRPVLWRTFKYYGPLAVFYPRPEIEIIAAAGEASTRFPFLIVRKDHEIPGLDTLRDDPMAWLEAVGDKADLYNLQLEWIQKDDEWVVDRAFLERFSGRGFE